MTTDDTQVLLLGSTKRKLASFSKGKINVVKQGSSNAADLSKMDLAGLETVVINVRPELNPILENLPKAQIFQTALAMKQFKLHGIYHQMGADRIANLVGATSLFPQKSVAVIDLGTCTTITMLDWVKEREFYEYKGGFITAGVGTSLAAIKQFTSNLPSISEMEFIEFCLNWKPQAIAGSPVESICHGVIKSAIAVVKEAIQLASDVNPQTQVILTGGWAVLVQACLGKVAPKLRPSIESNLALIGGNAYLMSLGKKQ